MKLLSVRPKSETVWTAALFLGCVALLYGHTLQVPFYLDDSAALTGNFLLRDLNATVRGLFSQRGLTNLSFALNYRFSGWALAPLHLVNILLHASCGFLVWTLLRKLFPGRVLPLLGALLFLAHPLQTQAVTYLVQRATVLGTFFFLVAFLCYLRSRESLALGNPRMSCAYLAPYLAALAAGVCAVLAKENTATLPLLLYVHDRLFPSPTKRSLRQTTIDLLPFCVAPLLLGGKVLLARAAGKAAEFSQYPQASLQHNDPLHYLVTQFSVFWEYLRLLIFPYGQALEHDYPVVADIVTLQNALALAGLLVIGWLALRFRRSRPLLTFGVSWFFLGLAVESSVIPLDPLFEHRLYLPMAGFLIALLDGLSAWPGQRWDWTVLVAALLICAPLTWSRNALWNDPVAFYEDNLRVVPGSERAMLDLAYCYEEAGRYGDMRRLLETAVQYRPNNYEFYIALARDYANHGETGTALALLEQGIKRIPNNVELYERAALIAEQDGRKQLVFDYLQRGLAVAGHGKWRLLNDLGIYHAEAGDLAKAEQFYRQSLELHADNPVAYQYLAGLFFSQRRWQDALAMLQAANRIEPGNPETLAGLVKTARQLDDQPTVLWAGEKLRQATVDIPAGQQR